jgi:hypothetical protein
MPPYGGIFMAVDPQQKHIFQGVLKAQSSTAELTAES